MLLPERLTRTLAAAPDPNKSGNIPEALQLLLAR